MTGDDRNDDMATQLRKLRERADEDFAQPDPGRPAGRHQLDLPELGLRVSMTRSRYPNRPDGVDQYAVTVSRPSLDRAPAETEVRILLSTAFGSAAAEAVERQSGGSLVRLFRVPAGV
jgi:hypothetical protein